MGGLVCNLCGGNNFIKEDGMFVCQYCGCKYTLEEAAHNTVEPLLRLVLDFIAKYVNYDYYHKCNAAVAESEYQQVRKYMEQAEEHDPGNWKLWLYKGIVEHYFPSHLYSGDENNRITPFFFFGNAMKFANEDQINERILPTIERLKQLEISEYIDRDGEGWGYKNNYPSFMYGYFDFYSEYDIAASYKQKTIDDWDSLAPIVDKHQQIKDDQEKEEKIQSLEKVLVTMNRYKNNLIRNIAVVRLFPVREARIKKQISECGIWEVYKKKELGICLNKLNNEKHDAERSINDIKSDAYALMRRNTEKKPAQDIWEETFVNTVSDYVEKCYVDKAEPSEDDKHELNAKLFPIGFGIEYYQETNI